MHYQVLCMSGDLIYSTRMPYGGIYYTSWRPIHLRKNPRGLMAFRKPWGLVLEASSFLVFSLSSSAGFLFGLLDNLLVFPRWMSRCDRLLDLPPSSMQPAKFLCGSKNRILSFKTTLLVTPEGKRFRF